MSRDPKAVLADPGTCGHVLKLVSSAFACDGEPGHAGEHFAESAGWATRWPLGVGDQVETGARVTWKDDRPVATYGDFLALCADSAHEAAKVGAPRG